MIVAASVGLGLQHSESQPRKTLFQQSAIETYPLVEQAQIHGAQVGNLPDLRATFQIGLLSKKCNEEIVF